MIIVDTTVWIDYFAEVDNLHANWLDQRLAASDLALTDLILCELLQGARDEKMFNEVRDRMAPFPVFNTGGQDVAVAAARNYRLLRARGITIRKTIDCVIATYCIGAGHTLLHRDRDFDPFEQHLGLRVVHPPTH